MHSDPPSRGRLLDRFLVAGGGSLLAYLLASHAVRSFLAEARQILGKVLAAVGG